MGKRGTERSDVRSKMETVRRAMAAWQPDDNCAVVMGLKYITEKSIKDRCGDHRSPFDFPSTAWVKAALRRLVESGEVLELICLQTGRHYWALKWIKPLDTTR